MMDKAREKSKETDGQMSKRVMSMMVMVMVTMVVVVVGCGGGEAESERSGERERSVELVTADGDCCLLLLPVESEDWRLRFIWRLASLLELGRRESEREESRGEEERERGMRGLSCGLRGLVVTCAQAGSRTQLPKSFQDHRRRSALHRPTSPLRQGHTALPQREKAWTLPRPALFPFPDTPLAPITAVSEETFFSFPSLFLSQSSHLYLHLRLNQF